MITALVYGYNMHDCEEKYSEYCKKLNVPCKFSNALFITSKMNNKEIHFKLIGHYIYAIRDELVLIGISKDRLQKLYNTVTSSDSNSWSAYDEWECGTL